MLFLRPLYNPSPQLRFKTQCIWKRPQIPSDSLYLISCSIPSMPARFGSTQRSNTWWSLGIWDESDCTSERFKVYRSSSRKSLSQSKRWLCRLCKGVFYDVSPCSLCWYRADYVDTLLTLRDLHSEEVYLNIFEDTTDPLEQRILAQRMIDIMALRPRLDLQDGAVTCSDTKWRV